MVKLLFLSILMFVALVSAASKSLTTAQYVAAASKLGVKELALLKAVDTVESSGNGFLASGKPKILFERHLFSEFTGGKWNSRYPAISSKTPGGYYGGEREWLRFNAAAKLSSAAAIRATSWGRFQILGEWYKVCGYSTPEAYAAAMKINEGYHLNCLVAFLKHSGLVPALNAHNWAAFARGYNGASYAKNHYDRHLATAYAAAVKAGWNNHHIPAARAEVTSDSAITNDSPSSHASAGIVAAIVVGCVVAAVVLVAIIGFVVWKKHKEQSAPVSEPADYRGYTLNESA